MKRPMLLTIVLGLFFAPNAIALEPGDTLWTRTYGGSDADYGYCVQQTTDGGYIIAGHTRSFGAGLYDVYLVKTDAKGETLWTRWYGGAKNDYSYSVQQTADGGYIVAGMTYSFGAGSKDFYLLKTDANGDTLWTRTYGGIDEDYGRCAQQTADGGYIMVGFTKSFGAGESDVWLLKTDANGDTLWTRTYGGSNYDEGYCVQQTSDRGYIIAGNTGRHWPDYDVYLVKTDAKGDTHWTRTYGGTDYQQSLSVQQTTDGGYVIGGATIPFSGLHFDVYLVKTDAKGDTLWTRAYGGVEDDQAYSVQQTSDSGYIVAGAIKSFGADSVDVYILKTDANGDTLWTRTYGGDGSDYASCVQLTSDGGYIVSGWTGSFGAGSRDAWLLKIVGEAEISMSCQNLTPILCRGKNLYFKLTVHNPLGENISGTLTFSGYSGYDCHPMNLLVSIPRTKTYPPGVTEEYYRFKVANAVGPGQYSASVGGTLGDVDLFCCMNTDIVQCGPWKSGSNTEWELVEVNASDYESSLPGSASLSQCYPNPFNAQTVIEYQLPEASEVKLEVYNLLGENVATLVNGGKEAGYKSVTWDACEVSSGIYFYKLTAGDYTETMRMMLVK